MIKKMTGFVILRKEKYLSSMAGSIYREIQGVQDDFPEIFHQENFASGSVLQYSTNVFVGIKDGSLNKRS
jgi:hypothetical protein